MKILYARYKYVVTSAECFKTCFLKNEYLSYQNYDFCFFYFFLKKSKDVTVISSDLMTAPGGMLQLYDFKSLKKNNLLLF